MRLEQRLRQLHEMRRMNRDEWIVCGLIALILIGMLISGALKQQRLLKRMLDHRETTTETSSAAL